MKQILRCRAVRFVIIIGCLAAVGSLLRWWDSRGEGFRIHKIQATVQYDPRWDTVYSQEELQQARAVLSQPFVYLGHGFQCYAFSSMDGKYVLKFFRYQRLRLPDFIMAMPSLPIFDEWRKAKMLALARRQDYLLRSCKTSWDLAKKETAMLMVHLNTTKDVFPAVSITDALGRSYTVALDECQFLLQRKAKLIKPTIAEAMRTGDTQEAKACIDRIFALLLHCSKCGIQDTDGALIRKNNLGFLDGKAIYIDGGKLMPRKSVCTKKDFVKDLRRLRPLQKWLEEEYPLLSEYFSESKERTISSFDEVHGNA